MSLLGTLTSGVSALKTFSKSLEIIGNNIANVNTTSYKASSTSFADTFSNTLRAGSSVDAAVQIGTGVQVAGIATNFSQGSLASTGNASDLGISGNGYFIVQDANGANFATRDGSFHWDVNGNLLNAKNYNVLDSTGKKIQVASFSTMASVSIGTDGAVTAFAADGSATSTQKVGLLGIADQSKLMKKGDNLFDFSATGSLLTGLVPANSNGLGSIQSGTLELSNVDLTDQFSNLITTQRSFQAGSRLVTVSDTVLEDIVNLKRQ